MDDGDMLPKKLRYLAFIAGTSMPINLCKYKVNKTVAMENNFFFHIKRVKIPLKINI